MVLNRVNGLLKAMNKKTGLRSVSRMQYITCLQALHNARQKNEREGGIRESLKVKSKSKKKRLGQEKKKKNWWHVPHCQKLRLTTVLNIKKN